MARRILTEKGVAALRPGAKRYAFPDPELRGHYVRVAPSGAKSFVVVARNPDGKQIWSTIGAADLFSIEDARDMARDAIMRIREGLPPTEPSTRFETFRAVADNYLKRHVEAKGLRSRREIVRILDKYILPRWENREFTSIRRSDVAALLDEIEDANGSRQADYALAVIRQICGFYEVRSDDYISPVVRKMNRHENKARDRILSDDEIRKVWTHAMDAGNFGAIVRLALLTAQRREKIAAMRWDDVTVDGIWKMQTGEREKGVGGDLKLPERAIAIIREKARMGGNPFIFAGRGDAHFNSWSKAKAAFDKRAQIAPWRIHDLRRTSRSLMAQAGVRPEVAERVMGHVIGGVEGVYDRHAYFEEKADALARLSGALSNVLDLDVADNVVAFQI